MRACGSNHTKHLASLWPDTCFCSALLLKQVRQGRTTPNLLEQPSTARKRIRPQALMSSVGSKHTELRHIVNLLLWATVRFASFTIVQGARFVSFLFISLPISIPAFTCLCKVREACDLFGRHLASANEIIISWLKWRSRWQLHPLTLGVERELENTVKAGGQNGELWKNPILFLPEQKVNGLKCGKWH